MGNKVAENPFKNRELADANRLEDGANAPTERSQASYSLEARGKNTSFIVVTALFVTLYVVSNVMAVKVIGLWNLFYFDAGTITFPFAYMLGDVLTEIWGYKTARKVIFTTLLCNIVMVLCTQIGVWLPSPDYLDATAQAYNTMFSYVPRIVIASLTGFLLGELSNAWLMDKIKRWTKGKRLWVRTIGSSAVAYWFDSLPFVLIAFAGTVSTKDLLLMIAFQYVSKLLIEAVLGTPMAYAVIKAIRRRGYKAIRLGGMERYSLIHSVLPREFVLLQGTGCRWKRCTFCDYHEDVSDDPFAVNREVLGQVQGVYGVLDVINSGSAIELDERTLGMIKEVVKEKKIHTLWFEAHYMYKNQLSKFAEQFDGVDVKFRCGVESFDGELRERWKKGIAASVTAEDVAKHFQGVCLLCCTEGDSKERILRDIALAEQYFEYTSVNVFCENTTAIKRDDDLAKWFVEEVYPELKESKKIEILINNTDLGVG